VFEIKTKKTAKSSVRAQEQWFALFAGVTKKNGWTTKLAVRKQDEEVGSSTTKSAFADRVDHTNNYHAIHSIFFFFIGFHTNLMNNVGQKVKIEMIIVKAAYY
jgi:hypothetical protein